jgi:lysyl-tRNA synthetase class II
MKQIAIIVTLAIVLLGTSNCATKTKTRSSEENAQGLAITGQITAIENGKDGYTATIKDANGKLYYATISIVNLRKSGGEYKSYKIGDKITVQGNTWKDAEGRSHITVSKLEQAE